jgi:hypothetical protein
MSKRVTKAAVKKAVYDDVMKGQPKSASAPRWVWHRWDHERDRLRTTGWIGSIPRPTPDYHREGSIQEIEQRENAGQKEMFE